MNSNNEQKIYCKDFKTLSSYKDKIVFKKHTHKINHIDLQKNLLMTSGEDDLIIIIDLAKLKYACQYYDIFNGTSFCKFLEPSTSTRILYYGHKSYKIFMFDYIKNEIIIIINLLKEKLYHLEYNKKSNLLISTQETNCILWKITESNIKPNCNLKNSYYSIINEEKRHIISASKYFNDMDDDDNYKTKLSIYKYDNNWESNLTKERDVNMTLNYHIIKMNFYKNNDHYFLIIMSEYNLEIIKLDDDSLAFHLNLMKNKELKFTCFEPTFTKELIIGYNNGYVELFNPFWDEKKIKTLVDDKYKKKDLINKFMNDIMNNEPRHEDPVVQVKISEYYTFYVSISDEMIIYQFKE